MNKLLEMIRAHIKISEMKETWCNFDKTYIPLEHDGNIDLQQGDRCKVIYQFEVIQKDDIIIYISETYETWYNVDYDELDKFADKVKGELILKGIFQK